MAKQTRKKKKKKAVQRMPRPRPQPAQKLQQLDQDEDGDGLPDMEVGSLAWRQRLRQASRVGTGSLNPMGFGSATPTQRGSHVFGVPWGIKEIDRPSAIDHANPTAMPATGQIAPRQLTPSQYAALLEDPEYRPGPRPIRWAAQDEGLMSGLIMKEVPFVLSSIGRSSSGDDDRWVDDNLDPVDFATPPQFGWERLGRPTPRVRGVRRRTGKLHRAADSTPVPYFLFTLLLQPEGNGAPVTSGECELSSMKECDASALWHVGFYEQVHMHLTRTADVGFEAPRCASVPTAAWQPRTSSPGKHLASPRFDDAGNRVDMIAASYYYRHTDQSAGRYTDSSLEGPDASLFARRIGQLRGQLRAVAFGVGENHKSLGRRGTIDTVDAVRIIFGIEAVQLGIELGGLLHCVRARAQMSEDEITDAEIAEIFRLVGPNAQGRITSDDLAAFLHYWMWRTLSLEDQDGEFLKPDEATQAAIIRIQSSARGFLVRTTRSKASLPGQVYMSESANTAQHSWGLSPSHTLPKTVLAQHRRSFFFHAGEEMRTKWDHEMLLT